jgi:CBS domain-containing protein
MNQLASQIDAAATLADLQAASARLDAMVPALHGSGIHAARIAEIVSGLNAQLFARLWTLLAPPEVRANSCLLVMGSEGRGEQILKTDQDNALLLRDGFDWPGLPALAARFNGVLADWAYPPCPGDIMLTNPVWRQPLTAFRETLRHWVYGDDGVVPADGPLQLAVFFDAVAVAGDAALLQAARAQLDRLLEGHDSSIARFAAPADQFHEPGSWLTRLAATLHVHHDERPLDLKKLGLFPLVHGARALALQHGVHEASTAARLERLAAQGQLEPVLSGDAVMALHQLMDLRLSQQLRQRAQGLPADNEVLPAGLTAPEREQLHTALATVKRWRTFLRQHFHLDAL